MTVVLLKYIEYKYGRKHKWFTGAYEANSVGHKVHSSHTVEINLKLMFVYSIRPKKNSYIGVTFPPLK